MAKKKSEGRISGIHNYCDRWCERCAFTSRCAVFESTSKLSPEEQDINNEAFWKQISRNFENTIQLLHKAAKERGIDLDEVINSEESKRAWKNEERQRKKLEKHALFETGMEYSDMVDAWMTKNEIFEEKGKELVQHLEMGIKNEKQTEADAVSIIDCMDVIRWYCHFIAIKFMRALDSKKEDKWYTLNNFPKDSDGSAKIAIIATERSLAAWSKLYEHFSGSEDDILRILATLEKIKRMGEKEFPNARKFVRPGFDE